MDWQVIYKIVVFLFIVTNLLAMGLETKVQESVKTLKNPRFILLILLWGWIVGPAVAFLIIKVIPMDPAYGAGLMLISLAPTAPFYPLMVRRAKGDMAFAASFTLLVTVLTVVLLPLMTPILIKGLEVKAMALAKPLLTMVLFPMLVGIALKVYVTNTADKLFPVIKNIGGVFTLITLIMTIALYWREVVSAVGSFAPGGLLLFLVIITILVYRFSFGFRQEQRSAMSLGMCTRNIAAVFVAYFGIVNPDPKMFVMLILVVLLTLIVSAVSASIFSRKAVLPVAAI